MFFAPPKVKSLSRYAEYGAYLGNRHFLVMLAVAFTAHLSVIAIYSMTPGIEIIRIPVRVLNIKLSGGNAGASMQMPVSAPAPAARAPDQDHEMAQPEEEEMKPVTDENGEKAVEKALAKSHIRPVRTPPTHAEKNAHAAKAAQKNAHKNTQHAASSESTFSTPKRYVREGESAYGKAGGSGHGKEGTGNGSNVSGDAQGQEVIERYTQKISQWIKNHQMEAKERCLQAKEATGECDAKGDVVVRIRIDRDGHILYNSVDKTSGKELVDQLAIQIVRASNPVPSVPGNYPSDSQLEFLVNVQVDLTAKQ